MPGKTRKAEQPSTAEPPTMLTKNQIVSRYGWTRDMVEIALPNPDGHLGEKYRHAPLYKETRVKWFNGREERLNRIREQAEAQAAQRAAEREALAKLKARKAREREQRRQERIEALASPTEAGIARLGRAIQTGGEAFSATVERVECVHSGSDGAATRRLYREIERSGDAGPLAAYLLRAQKSSERAKQYRGESVGRSYGRKGEAIDVLCRILAKQSAVAWGWGEDECCPVPHVLYVDLPNGQVSFHSPERGDGPAYPGEWDGVTASRDRIIRFAAATLEESDAD